MEYQGVYHLLHCVTIIGIIMIGSMQNVSSTLNTMLWLLCEMLVVFMESFWNFA